MPTADLDEVSIYYEWSGAIHAPVLVMSNSLGTTLQLWEPQMETLGAHFHVLRYDMRGHGHSSISPGPYSVEMLGGEVVGLLDAVGVDRAIFCGISLGGLVGQWLALHAPQRFERMILSNTASKIGTAESWNTRIEHVEREGLSAIADAVLSRWFTPLFASTRPDVVADMRSMLLRCDPRGYASAAAAVRDADFRENVKDIRLPVCILGGTDDPATTMADAEWMQSRIPGARLVSLRASHIANVEAAVDFNIAVLQFLGVTE